MILTVRLQMPHKFEVLTSIYIIPNWVKNIDNEHPMSMMKI